MKNTCVRKNEIDCKCHTSSSAALCFTLPASLPLPTELNHQNNERNLMHEGQCGTRTIQVANQCSLHYCLHLHVRWGVIDRSFLPSCSSWHFYVALWFQHFIVISSLISIFILIISRHSIFKVSDVISRIRQVSKSVLKGDAKPKQEADEAFYNSQKFEVLYCGKVV